MKIEKQIEFDRIKDIWMQLAATEHAKEGDATFFGAEIVPEKDMLLIVAPNEKATAILEAVQNLDCLKKPGSGIAFSTPAKDFTILGKK